MYRLMINYGAEIGLGNPRRYGDNFDVIVKDADDARAFRDADGRKRLIPWWDWALVRGEEILTLEMEPYF